MAMISADILSDVVAKAWADDAFKAQLMADPVGTLRAAGAELAANVEVSVVEDASEAFESTEDRICICLDGDDELMEEDLDKVAAGFAICAHKRPVESRG